MEFYASISAKLILKIQKQLMIWPFKYLLLYTCFYIRAFKYVLAASSLTAQVLCFNPMCFLKWEDE